MPSRLLAALVLWFCVAGSVAEAGGGPENLFLVVNQKSDSSQTIANHYIRWRKIPASNVLYLDWQGDRNECSGEEFRTQILQPIIDAVNGRRLSAQIDYVVYSTDFPWRINFAKDFTAAGGEKLPKQFSPWASLTGATYLWHYALATNQAMVLSRVNWYVPATTNPTENQSHCRNVAEVASRGFRSRRQLLEGGRPAGKNEQGQRYLLSTMLGVTVERGNTEQEILDYLARSVTADGTQPRGTFYFMKRGGIRSRVRHDCYAGVAAKLQQMGAHAVVQEGTLPEGATDVLGIMLGDRGFDLEKNKVTLAKGAICDHFTSYGGEFSNPHQTKLSAFLRGGAAGASGTVTEPFAVQAKFPLPSLHLHYRRGCSLAEAFYQSVASPYQLLIVGDPLCQPWAKPPAVQLEGVEPGASVTGTVQLRTHVTPQPGTQAGACELFLDGRLVARFLPTQPISLSVAKLPAGHHEFRVVCATADPLEQQGRAIVPFKTEAASLAMGENTAGNAPTAVNAPTIEVAGPVLVAASETLEVTVTGPPGTLGIDIRQNRRIVGQVEGDQGTVHITAQQLGRGPVALYAEVRPAESAKTPAPPQPRSAPHWLTIR